MSGLVTWDPGKEEEKMFAFWQNESSLSAKGPDYCEQTPTINPEADK